MLATELEQTATEVRVKNSIGTNVRKFKAKAGGQKLRNSHHRFWLGGHPTEQAYA